MSLEETSFVPARRLHSSGWLPLACLLFWTALSVQATGKEKVIPQSEQSASKAFEAIAEHEPGDFARDLPQRRTPGNSNDTTAAEAGQGDKAQPAEPEEDRLENQSQQEDKSGKAPQPDEKSRTKSGKETKPEQEPAKAGQPAVDVEVEDDSMEEEPTEEDDDQETPPIAEEPEKEESQVQKRIIGATATVMEKKSELLFHARVDTGAKSCSLHVEDLKIENAAEKMADNIGKVVRFNIKNGDGESHWLEARIAGYVIIKTTDNRQRRYKVPLTFRYKDFEKEVLVTLNNREDMEFPLLLGRNFLMNNFLVDVSLDSND